MIETEGEYEGVGMYITYGTDIEWPMVLSPLKNSPAEEAGVKPGDYINFRFDEYSWDEEVCDTASYLYTLIMNRHCIFVLV